jgi:hypothetical protein
MVRGHMVAWRSCTPDFILIRHVRGRRSSWSSEGRPAYGASEIDRGCPLGTGIDPSMWRGDGTAGEDDRGSGLVVMAPAVGMGEGRPGRHVPRWQAAEGGAAGLPGLARLHDLQRYDEKTN